MAVAVNSGGDFSLKINGATKLTGRSCTYRASGQAAEAVETGNGDPVFRPRFMHGYIEATFIDAPGVSTKALQATSNATIQLTLGSGKIVTGTAMRYVGDGIEADVVDGSFTARFEGTVTEAT